MSEIQLIYSPRLRFNMILTEATTKLRLCTETIRKLMRAGKSPRRYKTLPRNGKLKKMLWIEQEDIDTYLKQFCDE